MAYVDRSLFSSETLFLRSVSLSSSALMAASYTRTHTHTRTHVHTHMHTQHRVLKNHTPPQFNMLVYTRDTSCAGGLTCAGRKVYCRSARAITIAVSHSMLTWHGMT